MQEVTPRTSGARRRSGLFIVCNPSSRLGSVTRDLLVDGAGPCIDSASEGLGVGKALLAEPESDVEGAGSVMAHDDDWDVGIEFGVGAGGDIAHGHEE